jgi:hypothetical protein
MLRINTSHYISEPEIIGLASVAVEITTINIKDFTVPTFRVEGKNPLGLNL